MEGHAGLAVRVGLLLLAAGVSALAPVSFSYKRLAELELPQSFDDQGQEFPLRVDISSLENWIHGGCWTVEGFARANLNGMMLGILGEYNAGKSWFTSRLLEGTQSATTTTGIDLAMPHDLIPELLPFEVRGWNKPLSVEDHPAQSDASEVEALLTQVALDLGDLFVVVIDHLRLDNQLRLARVIQEIKNRKKKVQELLVVHNVRLRGDPQRAAELVDEYLKPMYNLNSSPRYVDDDRNAFVYPMSLKSEDHFELIHVFIFDDNDEESHRWNDAVFKYLQEFIPQRFGIYAGLHLENPLLTRVVNSLNRHLSSFLFAMDEMQNEDSFPSMENIIKVDSSNDANKLCIKLLHPELQYHRRRFSKSETMLSTQLSSRLPSSQLWKKGLGIVIEAPLFYISQCSAEISLFEGLTSACNCSLIRMSSSLRVSGSEQSKSWISQATGRVHSDWEFEIDLTKDVTSLLDFEHVRLCIGQGILTIWIPEYGLDESLIDLPCMNFRTKQAAGTFLESNDTLDSKIAGVMSTTPWAGTHQQSSSDEPDSTHHQNELSKVTVDCTSCNCNCPPSTSEPQDLDASLYSQSINKPGKPTLKPTQPTKPTPKKPKKPKEPKEPKKPKPSKKPKSKTS